MKDDGGETLKDLIVSGEHEDLENGEEDEDDAQRAPLCQPGHVPARKGRS